MTTVTKIPDSGLLTFDFPDTDPTYLWEYSDTQYAIFDPSGLPIWVDSVGITLQGAPDV
jgi:hypothetical protein